MCDLRIQTQNSKKENPDIYLINSRILISSKWGPNVSIIDNAMAVCPSSLGVHPSWLLSPVLVFSNLCISVIEDKSLFLVCLGGGWLSKLTFNCLLLASRFFFFYLCLGIYQWCLAIQFHCPYSYYFLVLLKHQINGTNYCRPSFIFTFTTYHLMRTLRIGTHARAFWSPVTNGRVLISNQVNKPYLIACFLRLALVTAVAVVLSLRKGQDGI